MRVGYFLSNFKEFNLKKGDFYIRWLIILDQTANIFIH